MSTSPLSSDDISAAAEVHAELGPEYREAVVESFLAKIDSEIGARIDARLATTPSKRDTDPLTAARRRGVATGLVTGLAVGTIVVGVPLSWFAVDIGGSAKLWHIWVVIAIVYLAGVAAVLVRNKRRQQSARRPD
jgi:F0F1-type ATP synthase assembly protein I